MIDDFEQQIDPAEEAARMAERVQILGSTLNRKLRDYIQAREPVERRMVEDLRQYHGKYDAETEARMSDPQYRRSKVFANVTRSKTNAAEARISDMLFPADDRNWDIQPTPVPEIEGALAAAVQQPQDPMAQAMGDQAEQLMQQAKAAAIAMRDEIDDQLTECQYNIEARRAIHQAAVLGTGVLKGPVIVSRARKQWQTIEDPATGETVHQVSWQQETKPAAEWVDVWNFFPDMSARTIEECEAVFERKFISRRQLRDLAKRPGYLVDQIRKVAEQEPDETAASRDHLNKLREISGITGVLTDSRYELWEYHGPIDREDLRACGCEVSDDALEQFDGTVLFIGDIVIFADVNPMETAEWPYSVWSWEEDEANLFGYGVPYLMRTPQRVLNSAWRMLMDNSGVAVGPQIVSKLGKVQPADGHYELTPMKHWFATDPNQDIRDVFATFEINSHQGELANIIGLAKQFADEETSLPLMTQGEASGAPQTATGMSIVMNAANVVLRRMVKAFDDYITKPMIGRFYDWNMQFNPSEQIKGDFYIDARGTTALLAKELQTQQLMQFAQFYGHPAFAPILQPKAASILRRIAESLRLPPDEVVPTDQDIGAMQQQMAQQAEQPADPRLQAAQMRAEADMAKLQHQAQISEAEMGMRLQQSEREAHMRMMQLELQRDIEMLKLAATKELTLEQIKAKLAETAIREKGRKELFAAERELKLATGSGI